jgi:hypothetical protein
MIKGSGSRAGSRSGSVSLTKVPVQGGPKNIQARILWIRICNNAVKTDEAYQKSINKKVKMFFIRISLLIFSLSNRSF